MNTENLSAYTVTSSMPGDASAKVHVVVAHDIAEAAAVAQRMLAPARRVESLEVFAPVLGVAAGSPVALRLQRSSASPPPSLSPQKARKRKAAAPTPPKTGGGKPPVKARAKLVSGRSTRPAIRRRDQLAAALAEHGSPMHIDAIAVALSTNRANANNVISDALRYGLVQRVGSRTGMVDLVDRQQQAAPKEMRKRGTKPPASRRKKKSRVGPSHADRLLQLLRERGAPVHLDQIVERLATTRGTVQVVIRAAAKAGVVRRLGSRTGLVELVEGE
jgi:predicted transcriptional regulator